MSSFLGTADPSLRVGDQAAYESGEIADRGIRQNELTAKANSELEASKSLAKFGVTAVKNSLGLLG